MKVAFVSCVKMKAASERPARDLYVSPWFVMARRFAERNSDRWFILSAAYGLLDPDRVIEPYEKTLSDMPIADRRGWAKLVTKQMDLAGVRGNEAIVLAGINYRRLLNMALLDRFAEVEVPMEGLMLGQQLSWLSKN
ncbi:hypothetical protein QA641_34920 [Bradyrhizobium sp. CB1650]|uniref:DUF6884 domain-containing protein n=1 Tax=Bradyrhizobium sp. CB1650 TaxID=3039153 RepID=UPI002434FEB4|nr:DUF6884 domain-containing protein [Bradyrhizobium sp. CB1650]WGD50739.1 hypothetical protein QA641_34920 [Bradyrhizobium sp. CB1650]